jgi:Nif-specific regulatory protein
MKITTPVPEVLEISKNIFAERDLPRLLRLIAKEAKNLMEADLASIFMLDKEKNELWSIVTLDGKQIRFDARLGIAGEAVTTGKPINIKDAYRDPRFYKKIDGRTGYRTNSLLVVPLKNEKGDVTGTFQALNKKRGSFTKKDEEILEALAEQVSVALETARIVGELRVEKEKLTRENADLRKQVEGQFSTQNIIGNSPSIQSVIRLIEQISGSSADVLITGESGTGKELVAKAIHYNSSRASGPFVALNCAALPESLVESELFGIESGVATGVHSRSGKFEDASGGTLFLDEIGDLSTGAQAKILRVLQERAIERVGGKKSIPVDVRIIAATNKDLKTEIKNNNFREDLFYRLRVIQIEMPPLREIPDDIELLANYFLRKYCQESKQKLKKFSRKAMNYLMNYSWPGNVRELENKIKRLIVMTPGEVITEKQLPESVRTRGRIRPISSHNLKERVEELEKNMIRDALESCKNNQMQAARLLGLSRWGLIKKIKRYGIDT